MLIITGSIAYDYIMDFPGKFSDHILPEQIHNINLSFIVNKFDKRRGGTAGNVSYSLALLHTPHLLFSAAGKDFDEYKKTFEDMGINVKYTKIYKDTFTATGFAMTDKTHNQIWGFFNGAIDKIPELKLNKVAKKNDLVYIGPQGARGSMSFVKQCNELGVAYMFDPGFVLTQISDEELAFGIRHAHYLIGNDYEITIMKDRVKNFATLVKNKIVITTLGDKGALIETGDKKITIKVAKPKTVVDPTGAGDAWRSGFFAGIQNNFDLTTCGQMGAVTASFTLEAYGAQEHTFTKKEFTNRYKKTYNQNLTL